MKKIKSRTGRILSLDEESGQVWVSGDKESSYVCIGELVNNIGNPNHAYGVEPKYQKKYYCIDARWLKYADKLKIKSLRLLNTRETKTESGQKLLVTYGYIKNSKFESLLKTRKQKENDYQPVILLKYSDMKIKGE